MVETLISSWSMNNRWNAKKLFINGIKNIGNPKRNKINFSILTVLGESLSCSFLHSQVQIGICWQWNLGEFGDICCIQLLSTYTKTHYYEWSFFGFNKLKFYKSDVFQNVRVIIITFIMTDVGVTQNTNPTSFGRCYFQNYHWLKWDHETSLN